MVPGLMDRIGHPAMEATVATTKPWKPPASLRICEQEWTVERAVLPDDDGGMVPASCLIRINRDSSAEAAGEIFFHELLHAIWALVGIGESGVSISEEYVVSAIAPTLYATLRRNNMLRG